MGLEKLKPRMWFLVVVGWAITILAVMSFTTFSTSNFRDSALFIVLSTGLTWFVSESGRSPSLLLISPSDLTDQEISASDAQKLADPI